MFSQNLRKRREDSEDQGSEKETGQDLMDVDALIEDRDARRDLSKTIALEAVAELKKKEDDEDDKETEL